MSRVVHILLLSFLITASYSANTRKKRNLELLLEPLLFIERLRAEAELRPFLPVGILHGSSGSHQSSSGNEVTTEHSSDHGAGHEHQANSHEHQTNVTEHQSNSHEHQSNGTEHQSSSEHGGKKKHKHKMHHHHHHHEGGGGH